MKKKAVHVARIIKKRNGREHVSHLLRHSYREGGKVKHLTVANLSHLPQETIEVVKRSLAGEQLCSFDDGLSIKRSIPHGHAKACLSVLGDLDLDRLISRTPCRQRDLVVALICQRLIAPGSKLSATRQFSKTTLGEDLGVEGATEAEVLGAMDWLFNRQERIERALARRHLTEGGYVLYDLSSSYFEGRACPLAKRGYSRDRKKGKLQITYGLICAPDGRPVSVEVFEGNTADSKTLLSTHERITEKFGIERVVIVGDRGMLTETSIKTLKDKGQDFVTALRAPAIRKLSEQGHLQLSLFDEQNLAEIESPDHPEERLIVCYNPEVARDRKRTRTELLAATERALDKIKASVDKPRGRLRGKPAGEIGQRAGRVINRHKMAKHFKLTIKDGHFTYERRETSIEQEARLDGIYVVRTSVGEEQLNAPQAVATYKQLKLAERAFQEMKSDLIEIRPIYHRLEDRVRCHVFLCMLAYYVKAEMIQRLAPLTFADENPSAAIDPVAKATRSGDALAKTKTKRTRDGHQVHSFADLMAELGTLCRNRVCITTTEDEFNKLTEPTPLQAKAFQLLGVRLKV